jgi:hypothetical protein
LATRLIAVLQTILNRLVSRCLSGLKIVAALVVPRKNAGCLRTVCIPTVLARLQTITPDVLSTHHTALPEMLAVLALYIHKLVNIIESNKAV